VRADGYIAVLLAELVFPENRSLKDKRKPLSSLRDTLRVRFHASFAEVGYQDTWQRATILVALAASSARQGRERLDEIERFLRGQAFEVAHVKVNSVDAVETLWEEGC
jgi:uncharacterized protein YlxP (DUF503 family)